MFNLVRLAIHACSESDYADIYYIVVFRICIGILVQDIIRFCLRSLVTVMLVAAFPSHTQSKPM